MFKIVKTEKSGLRRGELKTAHGVLETPFFMPDATRGFVKLLAGREVKRTGTDALVVNTLHLYLQPGLSVIEKAGGLPKFMNWSGPLLSDSGGYQVYSLIHKSGRLGKITDAGAIFRSPIDGSKHELTPEKSIQIQFTLGTDMMVVLDDCPPNDFSRADLEKAVQRTIAWAKRSKVEYDKQIKKRRLTGARRPLLFAVIQGGAELDLREACARELTKIGFDGYGFGARPVDKDGKFLGEVLRRTASFIPKDALRFALGIGLPEDIVRCAKMGWDMFDCVIPTREGRHGRLFVTKGGRGVARRGIAAPKYETININNARFARDFSPINRFSDLPGLQDYSKAFLHHLFRLRENLGERLATLNNLEFYQKWLKLIK